jgi:hypothetical protein
VSCIPLTRDRANPRHFELNDVLGNYSLTLIDSLSTLAILAGGPQKGPYTGPVALREFQDGVAKFVEYYGDGRSGPSGEGARSRGFDLDSKVQVFETVIRGVGGLLSAHLFATGELPIRGYNPQRPDIDIDDMENPLELPPISWPNGFKYDGQLLRLALDLSERLLPAFYTKTGLPYPRVNLRHGIPFYVNSPLHVNSTTKNMGSDGPPEITETCSAGAGSLVLEFTVLSRLSGDPRFEQAAKRAFWSVWERRSNIGLIGFGIDAEAGNWIGIAAGVGAGSDSFFEYAFKTHILLSGHDLPNTTTPENMRHRSTLDPNRIYPPLTKEQNSADAFLEAWHKAHAAIKRHLYTNHHHPHYLNGHINTGSPVSLWIDSLAAFYPGLLTLAGEVEEAVQANLVYTALWTRYAALPERWSIRDHNVEGGIGWWPGRPEFIESTYYLYRATRDPWYLYVGEMVLKDIKNRCYTDCGWAGLQDVRTGEKNDRMESFFLGETTKYLYLLFDSEHPLNQLDAPFVFTTEGHPLIIPRKKPASRRRRRYQKEEVREPVNPYYDENFTNSCPIAPESLPLTGSNTAARQDIFHAASFIGLHNTPNIHGELKVLSVEETEDGPVTSYKASTNYTFFPWTLPTSMLPDNAVCAKLPGKTTLSIEFPSTSQQSSVGSALNMVFGGMNIARYSHHGVTVNSLSGLRLTMSLEESDDPAYDQIWRVTSVNNSPLGRDESVFIGGDLVVDMADPLFNRVRNPGTADIVMVYETMGDPNNSTSLPSQDQVDDEVDEEELDRLIDAAKTVMEQENYGKSSPDTDYKSIIKSLMRAVTSVFDPASTNVPTSNDGQVSRQTLTMPVSMPLGIGAVPLPDVPDATVPNSNALPTNLKWTTIFMAGDACSGRLPDEAPRNHQVIVMQRGVCSFSEKLENIPSYVPSRDALQLVIVLDEQEFEDGNEPDLEDGRTWSLIRPLLDEEQLTPGGIPRHNPISMVLARGPGPGTYEKFRTAIGVGIRRRYFIESQGLRVENIHII